VDYNEHWAMLAWENLRKEQLRREQEAAKAQGVKSQGEAKKEGSRMSENLVRVPARTLTQDEFSEIIIKMVMDAAEYKRRLIACQKAYEGERREKSDTRIELMKAREEIWLLKRDLAVSEAKAKAVSKPTAKATKATAKKSVSKKAPAKKRPAKKIRKAKSGRR
jgi:hypothetical protein